VSDPVSLELCAGGGGTALGLELAGFRHAGLVEIDADCCRTMRLNRPAWAVIQGDIGQLDGSRCPGLGLVSGGLPCTPHSRGGKQLAQADDRWLWDTALRIIGGALPGSILLETSDAIQGPKFEAERDGTVRRLHALGYRVGWRAIDCSQLGVPQRRRRAVLVAFRDERAVAAFRWPEPVAAPTVGDALYDLMAARGSPGAAAWAAGAQCLAPTVVGGSKKHGGPDLGASQGKAAWRRLGIDPMGIADEAPGPDGKFRRGAGKIFDAGESGPMLTVAMAARIQGWPPDWQFCGGKTSAYGQVGNAFPPPVAEAIGRQIRSALESTA
jgi:DNA (cytosine-5)-methyltransferase 1